MAFPIFNRTTGETINFNTREERDQYVSDKDLSIYQGQLPELVVRAPEAKKAHEQRVKDLAADRNNPEAMYRMHDRQAMSNPANPYNATKGWIMFNAGIAGSAFNPYLSVLGITGDLAGQAIGDKSSDYLFDNPDKEFKLNSDISLTPRQAMKYGTGFVLGGITASGPSLYKSSVNTYNNAKNLYYGIQMRDIGKISSNPITHNVLNSPITTGVLTRTNLGKRALETIMRTTPAPNPIPEVLTGMEQLSWKPRINYILFGKNPRLRKLFGQQNMHYGDNSWNTHKKVFTGLVEETRPTIIQKGYGDVIDAYLYQKRIDPKIATLSSDGDGLAYFKEYISENYPTKNILQYNVPGNINSDQVIKTEGWKGYRGTQFEEFRTNNNNATINVAGHHYQMGYTDPSSWFPQVRRGFDIWKFQPDEYKAGWGVGNNFLESKGIELIDKAGTPIVFKQPWKTLH